MNELLKLSQLREGEVYYCVLSERNMLITSVEKEDETLIVRAMCYDGKDYDHFIIWDNQLQRISSYRDIKRDVENIIGRNYQKIERKFMQETSVLNANIKTTLEQVLKIREKLN